jgi:hypothetical protein
MIEASFPVRISVRPQTIFSFALIAATVLPLISIAFAANHPFASPFVLLLVALGSTHVGATAYLLADADIRRFSVANPVRMIVIPGVMLVTGLVVFSRPGLVFTATLMAFFLFQTWHFGAQNIGVASFLSLSDRGQPLAPIEKLAIKAGSWVGMLGVLKAMSPTFMIGAEYAPLPVEVNELLSFFYNIGAVLAIPMTGVAVWLAAVAFHDGRAAFGTSIFLSVTFLFPMYLSHDYMIGFMSFVVAHGLQYLIFLGAHSASRDTDQPKRSVLIGPALLILVMLTAHLLWKVQAFGSTDFTVGIALVFSLSLIHFWVDRFIWRMRDKERADWIRSRFAPVIRSLVR